VTKSWQDKPGANNDDNKILAASLLNEPMSAMSEKKQMGD